MTGISEVGGIGETPFTVTSPSAIEEGRAALPSEGPAPRGTKSFGDETGNGEAAPRWARFSDAPASLAAAFKSLGGGLETNRSADMPQGEVSSLNGVEASSLNGADAGRARSPNAPQGEAALGGLGTSRPTNAPQGEAAFGGLGTSRPTNAPHGEAALGGLGTSRPTNAPHGEAASLNGADAGRARSPNAPQDGAALGGLGTSRPADAPRGAASSLNGAGVAALPEEEQVVELDVVPADGKAVQPVAGQPAAMPMTAVPVSEIAVKAPDVAPRAAAQAVMVAAVEAVVGAMTVSSALAATGEGEIRIQLKPDVLDGSAVRLEAKGGDLQITVTPATRAAEEILVKHQEMFQAQLAERVANWRVNVGVSAWNPRAAAPGKTEEEA